MEFTIGQTLHGFTVTSAEDLPELDGQAFVLTHGESGARLLYLANNDANKAFAIGFKTPPTDDTGVFHILEHSVLCGSDKFPVKEPFVNLLKNSMQTFLNAMTFPDKTLYPVASTNEQDLMNLMDVYLDAVLHPAIYNKPEIFQQEGWHYEIEQDGESTNVVCNGVVFNEMKGALSDPDSVLYDALSATLFPDTAYRFESGGTPAAIPSLTYEQFLDNHSRHYRLDNSYLMLYGNLDANSFLEFLDSRYLHPCASLHKEAGAPNPLEVQQPVKTIAAHKAMVTAPENAAMALGYVIGHAIDRDRQVATDILLDAIAGSNEAPLKRALLDANLAADVSAFLADGLLQPFAVIQAKGLKPDGQERFQGVVDQTISQLANGGLDHALIEAALSHAEFVLRERNFGISDGVAYAMTSLSGWLYDDGAATQHLRFEDTFRMLREQLNKGYFEDLMVSLFLNNDHMASVILDPVESLEEDPLAELLERQTAALTDQAKQDIEQTVASLRHVQEAPDSPESLATLPHLGIADLGKAQLPSEYNSHRSGKLEILYHSEPTHGIAYAYRYFDLASVAWEELPYVTILSLVLGKLDTPSWSAADLDTVIQSKLGNLAFFTEVHERDNDENNPLPMMAVSSSALEEKAEWLACIADEVMTKTDFSDIDKIHDVLEQKKVAMEQTFTNAGHSCAMRRACSYFQKSALLREKMSGVDFYQFLCDLLKNWEEEGDALPGKLAALASRLFVDENCLLSFGGSESSLATFLKEHATAEAFGNATSAIQLAIPQPVKKNEAFVIPSDITFTAVGGTLANVSSSYNGVWLIAARALSYDYLWNEVRVKGGAYGAGFQALRTGTLRFYSYRDPKLDKTLDRFAESAEWIDEFNPSEEEFEGYVVSTVAGIDSPAKARDIIRRQAARHLSNLKQNDRLVTRSQVIEATPEDVRALADAIRSISDSQYVCTFGNAQTIKDSSIDFDVVDLLG